MAEYRFLISASWEERAETPDELAARFLRMIDSLKQVDPVFTLWTCGANRPKKFETVRDRYASEIAAGVTTDDGGEPEPFDGYWFGAFTRETPPDRSFSIRIKAGSTVDRPFVNYMTFTTDSMANLDVNFMSYHLFRAILGVIVDVWEPADAAAYSDALNKINGTSHFRDPWIQYLCPWLARLITPPSSAQVEHLPDGGLLMSATAETFDVANPAHLAVAREIGAAMAPLNELPWPSSAHTAEPGEQ